MSNITVAVNIILIVPENITDVEIIADITEAIDDMLVMDGYETSSLKEVSIDE